MERVQMYRRFGRFHWKETAIAPPPPQLFPFKKTYSTRSEWPAGTRIVLEMPSTGRRSSAISVSRFVPKKKNNGVSN